MPHERLMPRQPVSGESVAHLGLARVQAPSHVTNAGAVSVVDLRWAIRDQEVELTCM